MANDKYDDAVRVLHCAINTLLESRYREPFANAEEALRELKRAIEGELAEPAEPAP